jgi:hypothetical protein
LPDYLVTGFFARADFLAAAFRMALLPVFFFGVAFVAFAAMALPLPVTGVDYMWQRHPAAGIHRG